MTSSLEDEIQRIVANMDEQHNNQEQEPPETTDQAQKPDETIHIHYFPDAIVILKEDEHTAQVVDSIPVIPQKISFLPAYAIAPVGQPLDQATSGSEKAGLLHVHTVGMPRCGVQDSAARCPYQIF